MVEEGVEIARFSVLYWLPRAIWGPRPGGWRGHLWRMILGGRDPYSLSPAKRPANRAKRPKRPPLSVLTNVTTITEHSYSYSSLHSFVF